MNLIYIFYNQDLKNLKCVCVHHLAEWDLYISKCIAFPNRPPQPIKLIVRVKTHS